MELTGHRCRVVLRLAAATQSTDMTHCPCANGTFPCHLPVVLLTPSGTAAGALVSQHKGIAVVVLAALLVLLLTRALCSFALRYLGFESAAAP